MKTIIHGLILLIICNLFQTMSVTRNKTSMRELRYNKSKILTIEDQNVSRRLLRRIRVRKTTSLAASSHGLSNETLCQVTNSSKDLVVQPCSTTEHMQNALNTRLHEIILRTPFILTYDQRDVLARVVKKLWWNCRLLSRFMREESGTTFTPSSLEKLRVKQIREQLKPVMQEELYYCDQCNKSFGLFLGIWNHMKSIHNIVVKPTRIVQGQIRGTYNMRNRYTTLKDYYEAHDDRR